MLVQLAKVMSLLHLLTACELLVEVVFDVVNPSGPCYSSDVLS